jgi:hypothetical protein
VVFDTALYYQDWQDIRNTVPYFGIYADYQMGDAVVPGVDVQLVYSPLSVTGFTLRATGNWNDGHFTSLHPAIQDAANVKEGDRIPYVPEYTAALAATYAWPVTDRWMGQAVLSYSHYGAQDGPVGAGNTVGDSRNLLGMRFGFDNGSFGFYVFGNNLTDENGAIFSQAPEGGIRAFTQDYPRQIGLEVTYNFW